VFVATVARALTGVVWLLALVGGIRQWRGGQWRGGHWGLVTAALALVPFSMVAAQSYGGEILFRSTCSPCLDGAASRRRLLPLPRRRPRPRRRGPRRGRPGRRARRRPAGRLLRPGAGQPPAARRGDRGPPLLPGRPSRLVPHAGGVRLPDPPGRRLPRPSRLHRRPQLALPRFQDRMLGARIWSSTSWVATPTPTSWSAPARPTTPSCSTSPPQGRSSNWSGPYWPRPGSA
jgi:hypothetical protein